MFSTVKIENGVILDGKKLKCVKSYKLEQKERDDIAELTVNMDVRVFCKDDKPSDIKVGTIKADKPSGLRLADLANVIGEEVLVKVVYQIASTICSIMVSVVTSIIITREYMSVTQNEVDRMFNMSIKLVEVVAKMMADRFGTDQK